MVNCTSQLTAHLFVSSVEDVKIILKSWAALKKYVKWTKWWRHQDHRPFLLIHRDFQWQNLPEKSTKYSHPLQVCHLYSKMGVAVHVDISWWDDIRFMTWYGLLEFVSWWWMSLSWNGSSHMSILKSSVSSTGRWISLIS